MWGIGGGRRSLITLILKSSKMSTQKANYECLRGHATSVMIGDKISVAIKCPHANCKEKAWYQPTYAELDAAAREALSRPRTQVVYSPSAQQDINDTIHPYGY